MDLIWSARAKRDLKGIGMHIARNNRTAAVATVKRIVAAAEGLLEYPLMGHMGRVADTRELLVPGSPYIVVYCISRGGIRIAAVMHTSREGPESF
jgi:addiction module RelE/StbE family toxin